MDELQAPIRDSVAVKHPVKAHLEDGTTVLYPNGIVVQGGRLVGTGQRYNVKLQFVEVVQSIPVDSLKGMETYRPTRDAMATLGASFVSLVIVAGAAAAAIIGVQ